MAAGLPKGLDRRFLRAASRSPQCPRILSAQRNSLALLQGWLELPEKAKDRPSPGLPNKKRGKIAQPPCDPATRAANGGCFGGVPRCAGEGSSTHELCETSPDNRHLRRCSVTVSSLTRSSSGDRSSRHVCRSSGESQWLCRGVRHSNSPRVNRELCIR